MSYQAPQLLCDLWGCDRRLLMDAEAMASLVRHLVTEAGMHCVGEPIVYVSHDSTLAWGRGVTVAQLLSDSSAVMHTLADLGYVHFDLFTCAPLADPDGLCRDLAGTLRAKGHKIYIKDRTIRQGL